MTSIERSVGALQRCVGAFAASRFEALASAPILLATPIAAVQPRLNIPLHPDHDPRPIPPEPPLPSDCCDSGCDPCVHDSYAEELQDYRRRLAQWLERHPDQA